MPVGVYVPQKQKVITGQSQGSNKGKTLGTIGLGLLGAAVGVEAAPAGIAAGIAGGLSGAGGGAGLGGLVGGFLDKKPNEGTVSTVNAPNAGVPLSDSAMQRRLAHSQPKESYLDTLGEGLASIARVNDPQLTQMSLPPVYQAYVKAYNQRGVV